MKKSTLIILKVLVWIACLYPVAMLVYGAVTNNLGPDATKTITFSTGLAALRLLVISLAITPLRKIAIRKKWLLVLLLWVASIYLEWKFFNFSLPVTTGISLTILIVIGLALLPFSTINLEFNWLIKFRRLLGLFAFFYASLHLMAYVGLYSYFDPNVMLQDVLKRRFITVGVLAWLLLVPLALTSTLGWIKRLGGKNWNRLHKLVYVSVWLGIIHYWWQVKQGVMTPLPITLVLAALFIARPVLDWWKARKSAGLRAA